VAARGRVATLLAQAAAAGKKLITSCLSAVKEESIRRCARSILALLRKLTVIIFHTF
jgi:hypothetical protein